MDEPSNRNSNALENAGTGRPAVAPESLRSKARDDETLAELPCVQVLGCGSPNGDDSLAWEVIRRLRTSCKLPAGVALRSVDGGHQLLDGLDGLQTLILVDAVWSGSKPGTIHQFEWPDDRLEKLRPGTTHHMRPAEALQLAAALGTLPPRVVVIGVEAAGLEASPGLSGPVEAAIPGVIDRILEELGDA